MKPLVINILRHLKIFWIISRNAISGSLFSRYGAVLFILGKILRIGTFFYFMFLLVSHTKGFLGYTSTQAVFFYMTFNLIDFGSQFLFRDVYRFRSRVLNGELDGYFIKPLNSLLRSLLGGIDILDFLVLIPVITIVLWLIPKIWVGPAFAVLYVLLVFNSFLIATAFHILALGLGITTKQVDHMVFIYRDLTSMGRIPVDAYRYPINVMLTTIVPIGVMMTVPAKALMGLASPLGIISSFAIGFISFYLSLRYWRYAVTKYSSASS